MPSPQPSPFPPLGGGPDAYTQGELRLRNGRPLNYLYNVLVVLQNDPQLAGRLRRNTLTQALELVDTPTIDAISALRVFLESAYDFPATPSLLRDGAAISAPTWNPVAAWPDAQAWDGQPRIDRLLPDYFGAEDTPLTRTYGRRLLIAAAARARTPGCPMPALPVLMGRRALGASQAIAALSPDPTWAATTAPGAVSTRLLTSRWLLELRALGDTAGPRLHALLHRTHERPPPGASPSATERPRTATLIATTTRDELPRDPSRSLLLWPIRLVQPADPDAIARDRAQLLAEAYAALRAGEPWTLSPNEEDAHAAEVRAASPEHPWAQRLSQWIRRSGTGFTTEQALWKGLGIPKEEQTPTSVREVGKALRSLGLTTVRPRSEPGSEGGRPRRYVWPEELPGMVGGGPGGRGAVRVRESA